MAVTRQTGFPTSINALNQTTLAVTTVAVGDILICAGRQATASGNVVTGVSGGGATGWTKVADAQTAASYVWLWYGTVNATGAQTITVTFTTTGTTNQIMADSFTAGLGATTVWTAEVTGASCASSNASSTTITWATLTPAASNDLYWGYVREAQTGTAGTTTGFTYTANTAPATWSCFNGTVSSGTAYTPTMTQSPTGEFNSLATIFHAALPVASLPARRSPSARQLPALRRGRIVATVPAQMNPPIVVPTRIDSARSRALMLRPGRQVAPVPPQQNPPYPWPTHVDSGRSKFTMLRRGKRIETVPPQFNPPYPHRPRLSALARKLFALQPRGRRPFPVQPQIPVPPTIPPKLGAPRRLLNATARGRQWSAATLAQPIVTLIWPPPRLGAKRILTALTRGKRTSVPADQPSAPARARATRYGVALRRGRQATVTPPQIPVPPTIPGNRWSSARSKITALRRGKRNDPPLGITPPPLVWPPPKLGAARRLLTGGGRGRRSDVRSSQDAPLSAKRARPTPAVRWRGRLATPVPAQVTVPTPVFPARASALARRLFARSPRGRTTFPVPTASGFLTCSGQQLLLNGSPYRALGFNMWRAAITTWNQPPNETSYFLNEGTTLDTSLKDMLVSAPYANTMRTWFFQQFALRNKKRRAGFPVSSNALNLASVSVTSVAVGDLLICSGRVVANNPVTAVSGGGVASWTQVQGFWDGTCYVWLWFGTVSTPGTSNVTVTFTSSGTTNQIVVDSVPGQNANTTWTAEDTGAAASASGVSATPTYPSLVAGAANDVYWGYARTANAASSGGTAGFTYTATTSPANFIVYENALTNGNTYAPTLTQTSGEYNAIATIFRPSALSGSLYDWSAFDKVLSVADANGFKVIACLADEWSYETDTTSNGPGALTSPFYGSWSGSAFTPGTYNTGPWTSFEIVSYKAWVTAVVSRYAGDPRIAWWELGNELTVENPINTPDPNAEHILAGFVADMGATVKANDSNHLLSLGVGGNGNAGTNGSDYQTIHSSPYLDLCSYHDYQPYAAQGALTADQRFIQSYETSNGLNTRIPQAAALNKPIYIGEMGIHANAVPCSGNLSTSAPGRGYYLAKKAEYAFNVYTGIVGYLPWQYDERGILSDDFVYGPGDPSLGALSGFALVSRWFPSWARAARRLFALASPRGKRTGPGLPQTAPVTPIWPPPKLGAVRRLLSGAQRGRRAFPTPAQITVPKPAIPRVGSRWRMAASRRGRQSAPVLTQTVVLPPAYVASRPLARPRLLTPTRGRRSPLHFYGLPPTICLPTTATFTGYLSTAALTAYSSTAALTPYASTARLATYSSTAALTTYTSTGAITGYSSTGTITTYTSGVTFKTCGI